MLLLQNSSYNNMTVEESTLANDNLIGNFYGFTINRWSNINNYNYINNVYKINCISLLCSITSFSNSFTKQVSLIQYSNITIVLPKYI